MIELSIIRDLVTIFGVIAGLTYYVMTVRNAEKTRKQDVIFQRISELDDEFYNKWTNLLDSDWKTYAEWRKHRLEHPESYGFLAYMLSLLGGIGETLRKGIIDPDSLFSIYTPILVIFTWEKVKPIIEFYRDGTNIPTYLDNFEYLYDEAKKRYPEMHTRDKYIEIRQQHSS